MIPSAGRLQQGRDVSGEGPVSILLDAFGHELAQVSPRERSSLPPVQFANGADRSVDTVAHEGACWQPPRDLGRQ